MVPIGAVQTASGYEVAWTLPGRNQYSVLAFNSSGAWVSTHVNPTAGNDLDLEKREVAFNQDLNGDGTIGVYAANLFGRGGGQDIIVNALNGNPGPSGELDFLPGISSNQLWLKQAGNDLLVQVMGGQDRVTVSNWFANSSARLQEIKAGGLEIDAGLSQLVQAMATYSANNPAFNPATASQAPNDPALQTAIAAAWHA